MPKRRSTAAADAPTRTRISAGRADRSAQELLAGDWSSFDFSYALDPRQLVPHLLALEQYRAAATAQVLPPDWLEAVSGGEAPPRDTSAARAWVRQRFVPGSAPLSSADILAIHRQVAEQSAIELGSAGALRTDAVKVGRALVGGMHWGAPPATLPLLMERYLSFIDDATLSALPPVIQALLAHFFFDTIHPFLDGNGRTARLIAAAILSRRGCNLHGTYALIRHFYGHELRYHTILHQAWKRCPFELTPFVAFGIEGFIMELRSVDSFIKMKLDPIVDRDPAVPAFRRRFGARSGAAAIGAAR